MNKANTSDKKTSFLDLNIKVIGSDVIPVFTTFERDDFGFPIVNFPWLSGDVSGLPLYGVYISQLVRFARYCTSVSDGHSKNLKITSKLLTQSYIDASFENNLESSSGHTLTFCLNLLKYRFKNTSMFQKETLTRSSMVI